MYSADWEVSSLWGADGETERSIQWKMRQEVFPLTSYLPLPMDEPKEIPDIQAVFPEESADRKAWRTKRQKAVKDAFVKSWTAYSKHAWLQDEIMPIR